MTSLSALRADEADIAFLKSRFGALLEQYHCGEETKARLFALLTECYCGPERYYHNLHHIAEMLRLIGPPADDSQAHQAICFATWFHDAVYDTRRSDNEEKSAELAVQWLRRLGATTEMTDSVRLLILATKRHEMAALFPEAAIFLDADLSILGAAPEIYGQYCEAIRREYGWVEDSLYRRERKRILENFIRRERIYFTDELRERFETEARRNLMTEIEALQASGPNTERHEAASTEELR